MTGIATGLYAASQIEKHIDKKINNNNIKITKKLKLWRKKHL